MMIGPEKQVVQRSPCKVKIGSNAASRAANKTGMYSGLQPAMTELKKLDGKEFNQVPGHPCTLVLVPSRSGVGNDLGFHLVSSAQDNKKILKGTVLATFKDDRVAAGAGFWQRVVQAHRSDNGVLLELPGSHDLAGHGE